MALPCAVPVAGAAGTQIGRILERLQGQQLVDDHHFGVDQAAQLRCFAGLLVDGAQGVKCEPAALLDRGRTRLAEPQKLIGERVALGLRFAGQIAQLDQSPGDAEHRGRRDVQLPAELGDRGIVFFRGQISQDGQPALQVGDGPILDVCGRADT